MFTFFRNKNSKDNSAHLEAMQATLFHGLEAFVKQWESKIRLGETREVEELTKTALDSSLGHLTKRSAFKKMDIPRQKAAILFLEYLERNDFIALSAKLVKSLLENITCLDQGYLEVFQHHVELVSEKVVVLKGDAPKYRLTFYCCQSCGNFNLIISHPCLDCGFVASTEFQMRIGVLLSSTVIHAPSLLKISNFITDDFVNIQQDLGRTFSRLGLNLDAEVARQTSSYSFELLRSFVENAKVNFGSYSEPDFSCSCKKCSHVQQISAHDDMQVCAKCGDHFKANTAKSLVVCLYAIISSMKIYADENSSVAFNNLIASLVLVRHNIVAKGFLPTSRNSHLLLARFKQVGLITFCGGKLTLTCDHGAKLLINDGNFPNIHPKEFANVSSAIAHLNQLFKLTGVNSLVF